MAQAGRAVVDPNGLRDELRPGRAHVDMRGRQLLRRHETVGVEAELQHRAGLGQLGVAGLV